MILTANISDVQMLWIFTVLGQTVISLSDNRFNLQSSIFIQTLDLFQNYLFATLDAWFQISLNLIFNRFVLYLK